MAAQNKGSDGARAAQGMSVAEVAAVHHLTAQQAKAIKEGLRPAKSSSGGEARTAIATVIVMFAVLAIMIYFGK
jgi:hypothetical protein